MRTLRTFDDVVHKLGGYKDTAAVCRRPVECVYNWRGRGYFPAVLIRRIEKGLAEVEPKPGFKPHDKLFRIEAA